MPLVFSGLPWWVSLPCTCRFRLHLIAVGRLRFAIAICSFATGSAWSLALCGAQGDDEQHRSISCCRILIAAGSFRVAGVVRPFQARSVWSFVLCGVQVGHERLQAEINVQNQFAKKVYPCLCSVSLKRNCNPAKDMRAKRISGPSRVEEREADEDLQRILKAADGKSSSDEIFAAMDAKAKMVQDEMREVTQERIRIWKLSDDDYHRELEDFFGEPVQREPQADS